jgi:hypothetical protein
MPSAYAAIDAIDAVGTIGAIGGGFADAQAPPPIDPVNAIEKSG